MKNLMTLTFGGAESCDHVMVDLLLSALMTLQQAQLLTGIFSSKVALSHVCQICGYILWVGH